MGGVAHAACTCTVETLAEPIDAGQTTLRDAITSANANPGSTITFASGLSGSINLVSTLPTITAPTTISGPGASQITVNGQNNVRDFYVRPTVPGDAVAISGLTVTGGRAGTGAGIYSNGASLTLSGMTVTANTATSIGGGGIASQNGGTLDIVSSTISGNMAPSGRGAGVYTENGSGTVASIRSSTISGNTADDWGGGVYFDYGAQETVENSTIYGNTSVNEAGGGLYHFGAYDGDPGLTVTGSTITHNSAARGGGIACYGATGGAGTHQLTEPTLRNTIVSGNSATGSYGGPDLSCGYSNTPDNAGTITAAFSLIGSVGPATNLNQTGPNLLGQDPQLGPLASNGGPTSTQLPSASSPALDRGSAFGLNSDQRGVLRPIDFPAIPNAAGGDGSDIGAVERQPDNALKLGKLKRNQKKGTAQQLVILPLPDAGSVTIQGKGIKTKTRQVTGTAKLKLPVIAKGKKRKQENLTGKVKLKAKITYDPKGNVAKTLKRKLKLLKRT
jgi:hypothetical protein